MIKRNIIKFNSIIKKNECIKFNRLVQLFDISRHLRISVFLPNKIITVQFFFFFFIIIAKQIKNTLLLNYVNA